MGFNYEQFHRAFSIFLEENRKTECELEDYLISLWHRGSVYKDQQGISLEVLYKLLCESYKSVSVELPREQDIEVDRAGFLAWENVIMRQINDLHIMNAGEQVSDTQKYFGVNAPSGERWSNQDPYSYLEAALAASNRWVDYGNNTTGSTPMKVAAQKTHITWQEFEEFLELGQIYE